MATQSRLTPPLAPCSEEDIASFNVLALALRALPELSRENEKILNAEQLARLTEGIRIFQHAHLGRVRTRPILFRCLLALSTRYRFRYFTRHCFAHSFCVPCQFPNPPPHTHTHTHTFAQYPDSNRDRCDGRWCVYRTKSFAIDPALAHCSQLSCLVTAKSQTRRGGTLTLQTPNVSMTTYLCSAGWRRT